MYPLQRPPYEVFSGTLGCQQLILTPLVHGDAPINSHVYP